jgi:hypothetical protein
MSGWPESVTRTQQGLYETEGGYAQPATLRELIREGVKLQLELPSGWLDIVNVHISKKTDDVYIDCGEVSYRVKYTDAVKARALKEE